MPDFTIYGNAGHRFPRTTKEAFGRDEHIVLANEHEEIEDISSFNFGFALVVYGLAVVVIGFIVLSQP